MAWWDNLLEQGYTLPGTERKTIVDGGEPGYHDTSTLGKFAQGLQTFLAKAQAAEEKRQKEMERQVDMYKTLREAGYDPKSAYDAVKSGRFPNVPAGESVKQKQEQATLRKTEAEAEIKEKEVKEGAQTESGKFRAAVTKVRKGELDWEDLEQDYPDRIDTIEKLKTSFAKKDIGAKSLTKKPIKQVKPFQIIARMKKEYASMDQPTMMQVSRIKTYKDLMDFLKNMDALESQGVDVDAISEYYADEINELINAGAVKEK